MPVPDYYATLGVDRNATPEEIKRAFRGLAMQWHPDRNPTDPTAEARFKEIVVAWETLSDPERRRQYDRLGPFYREDGRPPTPEEVSEVLSQVLGNLFRKRADRTRGEDIRHEVRVTLEEVLEGVDRVVEVPHQVRCADCDGEGAVEGRGRRRCTDCAGTGKLPGRVLFRSTCPRCGGRGWVSVQACSTCSGQGHHGATERLRVRVPAGAAHGQKLKVPGKGHHPGGAGPSGDLYVVVVMAPHPVFRRRGRDLVADLPLTYPEAVLGAEIQVPTLEESTTIRVPPGTPTGRVLRLAGRGLPALGGGTRGDLHLRTVVEVPMDLDAAQRQALSRYAELTRPEHHPARRAFDASLQDAGTDRRRVD